MKKRVAVFMLILIQVIFLCQMSAKNIFAMETDLFEYYTEDEKLNIYQFGNESCPYCRNEKTFLNNISEKYNNIEVNYIDSSGDENYLLWEIAEKLDIEISGVPFLLVGSDYIVGYSGETTTGAVIEEKVVSCLKKACDDLILEIRGSENIGEEVIDEIKLIKQEEVKVKNEIVINNLKMYKRLRGKIMLKVESLGEAYYINPDNKTMHSLGRPDDAFVVMREQGIGILNKDLEKIPASPVVTGDEIGTYDKEFTEKHLGKIFLQIEKNGEAWYVNPEDGLRYFLGRPADAFLIMRGLGLGISNYDFLTLTN